MAQFTPKQWVRIALGVLLALDVGLLAWNYQASDANPKSQAAQRDRLKRQHQLLGEDVRMAAEIRTRLPEIEQQCASFVKERLLPVSSGYSTVVEDLNRISAETGLHARGIQYRQKDLPARGVAEVQVAASVEGGYANLVRFINAMEKSKQFYLLEELALVEATTGNAIRLNLQLKTYFRLDAAASAD